MKLIVNAHKIAIKQEEAVNEKEINVSECEFEFAEEITEEYVKEAYFTLGDKTYKQIIVNNKCSFPQEVLVKEGTVELGVVAYLVENDTEIIRYNPTPVYFKTDLGSLKDAENSEPITPSEMEQYEQALQDGLTEVNSKIEDIDQALEDVNTAITETNNLDLDVSKSGKTATVTLTKKDATTKVITLEDGTSLMFQWSGTSLGVKTDEDADYTYVNLQGVQGEQGPMGAPFTIKKTYSSVTQMNADFNNMQVGDYVMITSSVEVEDNAKLYCKGTEAWIFITDFSGATGIQGPIGPTPNIQIGTVSSGDTPGVTRSGTNENPVLNFTLVKGDTGETGPEGPTGKGISSIVKTATVGLVDTYTITYTDNTTTTFTITNGEVSLEQLNYVREYSNALLTNTNTGNALSLSNTIKCPMPIELKPSELSQDDTPSTETPQTIHTITGNNKLVVRSKNLFDKSAITSKKGYLNTSGEFTSSNSSNYTTNYTNVLPETTYTLTGSFKNNVQQDLWGIYFFTKAKEWISKSSLSTLTPYTFTTPANCYYIQFQYRRDLNVTFGSNVQLELGSTATAYESYEGSNYTLTLGEVEFCKVGDYSDQFYKATASDTSLTNGKWYIKKNVGKITSYDGESITTTYISTTGGLDTGATVYYGLTTPTYTLLNDTLQTELDNIYNWVLSYNNQTNIAQDNADLPLIITAITSKKVQEVDLTNYATKSYVDNAISSAITDALGGNY